VTSTLTFLRNENDEEARMIRSIQDEFGNTQQSMKGIIEHLRRKYEPFAVDEECVAY